MATRYYTEEAYELIKQTIEQIDTVDVCSVKDFFSDLLLRLGQFLKIYTVDQYQNDMQSWYNIVLDSHNTTLSKVDSIFLDVECVDFEYRDIMNEALDSIVSFRNTLNCLRDVISGETSLADGQAAVNGYLNSGKSSLNSAYDTILTKMEAQVRGHAFKELIGDVLKLGTAFCKCVFGGGTIADYKKYVDTLVATFNDFGSLTLVTVMPLLADVVKSCGGMSYEEYLDNRFCQLMEAKEYKDKNSTSDWLGKISEDMDTTLAMCPEDSPYYPAVKTFAAVTQGGATISEGVDIAVDVYDILSGLKDTHDNIDEWMNGKYYTPEEYNELFKEKDYDNILEIAKGDDGMIIKAKVPAEEIVKKVVSERTGIPMSGWTDPKKSPGNTFKFMGTLWSYLEKTIPDHSGAPLRTDEWWDVAFGKFKESKFLKDVFDFARDLDELIVSLPGVYPEREFGGGTGGGRF